MIYHIFTVYDSKVGAYNRPFFEPSKGSALRSFMDAICDKDSQLSKHSEDYTLFHIGEYDDQTAVLTSYKTPASLGVASELKSSSS
ncbi:nonstructural protein [Blackfly microvirus SF02]|uniref:Nonstructural protein n=1 Tax=Blackfly microvirus SF02 TaxID=2576452 RepID=A0A4P8PM52_9VIRU|nr:nonstructural protein [Blackfly microvirus SF02]